MTTRQYGFSAALGLLFLLCALAAIGCGANAPEGQPAASTAVSTNNTRGVEATVLHVYDGDTLKVRIGSVEEKVRVIGVDTPERADKGKPAQEGYEEATSFTRRVAGKGQKIRLVSDSRSGDQDNYRRLLRHVILEDGSNLAHELIGKGLGFAFVRFPFEGLEQHLLLENQARTAGRGVWAPERIHPASWNAPHEHVGQVVQVEGRIVKTHRGGKVTFLNFDQDHKSSLSLVVYAAAYSQFSGAPDKIYQGSTVEVLGRVTTFKGRAQVTINHPDQLARR